MIDSAQVQTMSRLPDLVQDSSLRTEFRDAITVHLFRDIDAVGRRFYREEQWKREQRLGRGGFGQVWLQRCVAGAKPDSLRAVKIINKSSDSSESLNFNRELEVIAKFSNDRYKQWFVKSFGWFEDPDAIFITMEYCHYGDLHHYLKKNGLVPTGEVQQLAYQILEGLDQMHKNDFAHRDLKPGEKQQNILIKSAPPAKWWIVLADFGISKRADESNGPTTAIKGTDTFMAPELLGYLGQVRPKLIADFKAADMWALGEILFQMLTGETTFQNPLDLIAYCCGQRQFPLNRLPMSATDEGRSFITSIMAALPQDRRTTIQCIQHRWIELLRVQEELAALNLEQSSPEHNCPLLPEISSNESASARWSNLLDPEHGHTQTTAHRRLERPLHSDYSDTRQFQPQSTSSDPSIPYHLNDDQESIILADIKLVQTLAGPSAKGGVTFSPDGKRLATYHYGYTDRRKPVQLWSAESGTLMQTLAGSSKVAFSLDSKRLMTNASSYWTGKDNTLYQLWSAESGTQTIEGRPLLSFVDAFSPDGKRLVTETKDRKVQLWSTESGILVRTLMVISAHPNMTFSPDSKRLVIRDGENDTTMQLWSAESGTLVRTFEVFRHKITYVIFSPDSKRLVTLDDTRNAKFDDRIQRNDRKTRLWSAESGALVQTFGDSRSAKFSPDSKRLVTIGYNDGTVRLWSAESGTLVHTLKYSSSLYTSVSFSPDGKRLATYTAWYPTIRREPVQLWSAESGTLVQTLPDSSCVAFSLDSKRLVTTGHEQMRLQLEGPSPLRYSPQHSTQPEIWKYGRAKEYGEAPVQLWSAESGTLVQTLAGFSARSIVTVSPDGKRLTTRGYDETMRLWSAGSGTLLQTLTGCSGEAFSPDGKWLATIGHGDATVRLWSAESGTLVQTFAGHSVCGWYMAFSPDSKRLATQGSRDATVCLWSLGVKKC